MAASTQLAPPPAVKPAPAALPPIVDRLKTFWEGRTQQQRLFLAIGLAVTLGAAAFFVHMVTSPDMKPLMSGLEAADAKTITAQLDAKKIPYTLSPDGTSITVPADQLDAARLEVSSHESTRSGRIGFEIFDKTSWGQTEFDEKVNYQRALEGELERTIGTMRNVKSASVHLVMATDSVFVDRARSAKGSVTLRLKGEGLTREEVKAIQRLVAGAVQELKPQDVTIIDADSERTLSSTGPDGLGGDDELELGLTKRLVATLAPVVGADRLHASVNVEYETNSSEENLEKYDPQVTVPLNMQKSEEITMAGAGTGGVPGTSSNVPKSGTPNKDAAPTDPAQSSKTESATYGVNRVTRHTLAPAGGIRRLTAAIVVDDAVQRHQDKGKWVETRVKRRPEDLKLIAELAQAAIGYNQTRGDVVTVQNLSFDQPAVVEPAPLTFAEKTQKQMSSYASAIRYGVMFAMFGLVYLLMIRPIQQRALAGAKVAMPVEGPALEEAALPAPPPEVAAMEAQLITAERAQTLRRELAEFVQQDPDAGTTAIRAWLKEGTA